MPLPNVLEVVPVSKPVTATLAVPGSKSITNRALLLAALGRDKRALRGALWSADTHVMVECLRALGFHVEVEPEAEEPCNRTIVVQGRGGVIPNSGTPERPVELYIGNAGTAARFLAAFVCLGKGSYRLHGTPRMHERPQEPLFRALRELGYRIDSPNSRLPAVIHGAGPQAGSCRVSIAESSQFASALLLCARQGGWKVAVVDANVEESPYVAMTSGVIGAFSRGGDFHIEPDTSSGSYFAAAAWLLARRHPGSSVHIAHWPDSSWQIDSQFPRFLPPPQAVSREHDLGDAIMTAIVMAPFGEHPVRFTDLGRLRVQESERVQALRQGLTALGANVVERGDTLEVSPSVLHGGELETYDDHRLAMCFAVLGLAIPGVRIKNPACVRKTFPNFFDKLAAPVPLGLGVELRDAATQRRLASTDLFDRELSQVA